MVKKTIADDLNGGGIVIDIKKPDETLQTLTSIITRDRKKWKNVMTTLMQ